MVMVDCRRTLSLRTAATSVAAMAGTRPARSSARRLISQPTSSLLLTAWAAAQTSARSRTASQLAVTSSTSSSRMARHTSALPTLRPLGWRAKSMKSTEQRSRWACSAGTRRSSTGSGCGHGRTPPRSVTVVVVVVVVVAGVAVAVGAVGAVGVGATAEAVAGGNVEVLLFFIDHVPIELQ